MSPLAPPATIPFSWSLLQPFCFRTSVVLFLPLHWRAYIRTACHRIQRSSSAHLVERFSIFVMDDHTSFCKLSSFHFHEIVFSCFFPCFVGLFLVFITDSSSSPCASHPHPASVTELGLRQSPGPNPGSPLFIPLFLDSLYVLPNLLLRFTL